MTEQQPTTPEPVPAPVQPELAQPEPTPAQPEPAQSEPTNPYQSIIDQQNEQIKTLMEYNAKLSGQITQMVQNGYQAQQSAQPQPQPHLTPSLSDDKDWSLESLAKEIGKRD